MEACGTVPRKMRVTLCGPTCRATVLLSLLALSSLGHSLLAQVSTRGRPSAAPSLVRTLVPDSASTYFAGNVVRGGGRQRLVQALMGATDGHFAILVRRSHDDGATWSPVIRVPIGRSADAFDPQLLRLGWDQLLLGFHSEGSLRFLLSRDGGRHWSPAGTLAPPKGSWYSEVFMLRLPGAQLGRVALLYAATRAGRTRYELRTSTDDGRSWTPARRVGEGGWLRDGLRASLAIAGSGVLWASFSVRDSAADTVRVAIVPLASATFRVMGRPHIVATAGPVAPGVGVFPLLGSCDGEPVVWYSVWRSLRGSSSLVMQRLTRKDVSAQPVGAPDRLLERSGMESGFGRLWIYRDWTGEPWLLFVEATGHGPGRVLKLSSEATRSCRE